ncbi:GGDEF domain-containing protein [Shewanella litorisediminis]|uniref:diguanylate cyclase n=1 Tax=Shewanella litorisediminis TaxID=1173586 RepID=A0ABX7G6R7_9GAMM|nr:GGDEF domain-containing protein [Shewanella litorisediminis]MCL2916935.1 GGDEF domain-containing protein [Shewanella litorisediminis]QRH02903.1 GGDEF domain-containing protein [Shewanella litorisediminis]
MNKDEKLAQIPSSKPLPAMRRRLWQSFMCIALLGILTGIVALGAIHQQASEFTQSQLSQAESRYLIRDALLQQLGLESLGRDWHTLPPTSRSQLLGEMRARQQGLVSALANTPGTERDMAIRVMQGLTSLQPEGQNIPVIGGLAELSRDLAIRVSSLDVGKAQQLLTDIEKRRWQLTMTVMFLSLLCILLTQFLAWHLLGRHFIRPLIELGRQVDNLSAHRKDSTTIVEPANQEVKDISENLRHIHRQLQHQQHNPNVDQTTGLASRSALNHHLQQEWLRGLRRNEPVSLLLLSADPVMLQHDHGLAELPHTSLTQLVNIAVEHTARAQDYLAHYDGNKLAIVLSCTDLEQAIKLAHQLCYRVHQAHIATPMLATHPWVTVSVGVASRIPRSTHGWDILLQEAEEALLQARAQGGNQAMVAPCLLPDSSWLATAAIY